MSHTDQHPAQKQDPHAAAADDSRKGQPQPEQPSPFVYLSNLPVEAYEGSIKQAFEKEGIHVASIQLLQKGSFNRRRNAGLATVKLASAADVERCCELLDGKTLHVGCDTSSSSRPMIVRRNKFECCQLGYDPQQQQQQQQAGSHGSSSDEADP